jgi:hypothetical protein
MEKKFNEFKFNEKYTLKRQLSEDYEFCLPDSRYYPYSKNKANRWLRYWNNCHRGDDLLLIPYKDIVSIYESIDLITKDADGLGFKMYCNDNLKCHFTQYYIDYSLVFCLFIFYKLNPSFLNVIQDVCNNIIEHIQLQKATQKKQIETRKNQDKIQSKKIKEIKTYIMKDDLSGLYKIGKSINPKYRERTLQSEKPSIRIVKIFNSNIEKKLHGIYDEYRVRGEWFKLTEIQLKYICTHF